MRSHSGPSASRLGADADGRRPTSAARPRTSVDREAILDRYRRTSPGATRSIERSGGRAAPSSRLSAGTRSSSTRAPSTRDSFRRASAAGTTRAERVAARARENASPATRRAADRTRGLRDLTSRDPARAQRYERAGRDVAIATDVAISVGISAGLGCYYPGWYCNPGWYCGWWWGSGGWCYPYGGGYSYWWNWGGYPYSWYCHPFGWTYWGWYGYWPYHLSYWYPSCYSSYYSPPLYYSTVVYQYVEEVPVEEEVVVQEQAGAEFQGEGVVGRAAVPAGPDSGARASGQYLTLGDQAFRDGRYADAVHFYAKAVEFAPGEGVLYLVLSDGLFATGDYHYGAYALRKALELDPTLAQNVVDKHGFYADPLEFDRQLAVLESYLADHPGDDDARLMLAANYLFGGRPAAAVDLLEATEGAGVRAEAAGGLVLTAARAIQHGEPAGR